MPPPGLRSLLLAMLAAVVRCDDPYSLSQVLFCQPSEPQSGLLKIFNEDQMFSYNFTDNSTSPWINDFDKWRGLAFPDPSTVQSHVSLCHRFRQALTNALVNIMPEARGDTRVTVFTARPLRLGVPNTLICAISDVYPPALNITWKKGGQILSTALDSYKYVAMEDLTFRAFSYLNVTAYHNDFFSCEVQVAGDDRTIVAYWSSVAIMFGALLYTVGKVLTYTQNAFSGFYSHNGGQKSICLASVGLVYVLVAWNSTVYNGIPYAVCLCIPQYPVPSELLLYGLCGSGFTLGIIFLLLGVWFCYFARKLHNTD